MWQSARRLTEKVSFRCEAVNGDPAAQYLLPDPKQTLRLTAHTPAIMNCAPIRAKVNRSQLPKDPPDAVIEGLSPLPRPLTPRHPPRQMRQRLLHLVHQHQAQIPRR